MARWLLVAAMIFWSVSSGRRTRSNRRALRALRSFGGWQLLSRRDGFIEYEYVSPSRGSGRPPP